MDFLKVFSVFLGAIVGTTVGVFLLVGLLTWCDKHDHDPIEWFVERACEFWEKRL